MKTSFSLFSLFCFSTLFAQMTVEDKDSNVLFEIKDEGTVGSLFIPDTNSAPVNTLNKLYNLGGTLNWNGSPLTTGGTSSRGWAIDGNNLYPTVSGNIGIGTTNPLSKLSVGGDGAANAVIFGDATGGLYYGGHFKSDHNSGRGVRGEATNDQGVGVHGTAAGANGWGVYGYTTGSAGRAVYGYATQNTAFAGYFAGKMYAFNKNSEFDNPLVMFESESNTRLDLRGPGTDKFPGIQFSDPEDSWKGGFYLNEKNNNFEFYTDLNGSSPRMVIVNGGNVGINEAIPEAKLDVNGDVNVQENLIVTGAYKGNIGPNNGAPFPRPAYDSGRRVIAQDETLVLNHGIGGNPDNYHVELWFYNAQLGRHNQGIGGDIFQGLDAKTGANWHNLTDSQIKVSRGENDGKSQEIRVRIWVYN